MTVDAALVTLDFALRHALLPAARGARLEAGAGPACASTMPFKPSEDPRQAR